jgi:hypothetical protein
MLQALECAAAIAELGCGLVAVAEAIGATVYFVDTGDGFELARPLGEPVLYVRSLQDLARGIGALTIEQWELEVDCAWLEAFASALVDARPSAAWNIEQTQGVQSSR